MFTAEKNYKKLLEIEKIELFTDSDKVTLSNSQVLRFNNTDNEMDDSWISIEVWTDENNEIKILESDDNDYQEISEMLDKEIINHVYKLIENELLKTGGNKNDWKRFCKYDNWSYKK